MVVEEVVFFDGQFGLMLELLELVPLGVGALQLHAVVVLEISLQVNIVAFLHLVNILPYQLRVPQRFYLSLEYLYLLVFLVNGVL